MSDNGQPTANYIPDGYTQAVYFAPLPGIYKEFRATYRPLTVATAAKLGRELNNCGEDVEQRQWVAARWMSQQTVSWDIKKNNGELVNHKDVNECMRIGLSLFNRYWNVINNVDGGDPDPEVSQYERQKQAMTDQATAMSGVSQRETLEKN
jgi:hypothetical protein